MRSDLTGMGRDSSPGMDMMASSTLCSPNRYPARHRCQIHTNPLWGLASCVLCVVLLCVRVGRTTPGCVLIIERTQQGSSSPPPIHLFTMVVPYWRLVRWKVDNGACHEGRNVFKRRAPLRFAWLGSDTSRHGNDNQTRRTCPERSHSKRMGPHV